MPNKPAQIEEILYDGLITLDDPEDRKEFLDQTCRDNPHLRERLETLAALHHEAEAFFSLEPELEMETVVSLGEWSE